VLQARCTLWAKLHATDSAPVPAVAATPRAARPSYLSWAAQTAPVITGSVSVKFVAQFAIVIRFRAISRGARVDDALLSASRVHA